MRYYKYRRPSKSIPTNLPKVSKKSPEKHSKTEQPKQKNPLKTKKTAVSALLDQIRKSELTIK